MHTASMSYLNLFSYGRVNLYVKVGIDYTYNNNSTNNNEYSTLENTFKYLANIRIYRIFKYSAQHYKKGKLFMSCNECENNVADAAVLRNSAGRYQVRYAYHNTYTLVSRYTLGIATQQNTY